MSEMLDSFRLTAPWDQIYCLGGEVRPGSVRDSIWRAGAVVELLARDGSIATGKDVLIVGAGISGMVATIHALAAGANVVLLENREGSYAPFATCVVREICPNTYDYPMPSWTRTKHPHRRFSRGYATVVKWKTATAAEVFEQVELKFSELTERFSDNYTPAFNTRLESPLPSNGKIGVQLRDLATKTATPRSFDVVILATGIGELNRRIELPSPPHPKNTWSSFEGFCYYDNDPILHTNGPQIARGKRVLLVGGGDGSLVDFVRLMTGQKSIRPTLRDLGLRGDDVKGLQDIARYMWLALNRADSAALHNTYDQLQARMVAFIDDLWTDSSAIQQNIAQLIISDPADRPKVQVAIHCCHFGFAYLANRVLAQLIARHLATDLVRENGGMFPFRIGVTVDAITAIPATRHVCTGDDRCRADCARYPHDVTFGSSFCRGHVGVSSYLATRQAGPSPLLTITTDRLRDLTFDRILVRTGAKYTGQMPEQILAARKSEIIWQIPPAYVGG